MIFTDAVKEEPSVFIKYAGDFLEFATECGPTYVLELEFAKVRFYTYLVARDEMEPEDLQEAVHEVLDRFGTDPSVRPQLWGIAREFLERTPGAL